jgi:trehalose utilization protein
MVFTIQLLWESEVMPLNARTATLDEDEHGLTDEVLQNTDVLMWWGHMAHDEVRDDIVDKI